MDKMEVEKIIEKCRRAYKVLPTNSKDTLDSMSKREKDRLLVNLICLYYEDISELRRYLKYMEEQTNEAKQLNEKLNKELLDIREKNILLKIENKQLSIKLENSIKKNISYRTDVDTMAIHSLLEKNYSKSEIAKKLGVSRQTIYRRLKENK